MLCSNKRLNSKGIKQKIKGHEVKGGEVGGEEEEKGMKKRRRE